MIIGESGAGVTGAEAYGADPVALVDAYWASRTNDPLSASWSDVSNTTAKKEGAIRSATAYLDATYGAFYIGVRKTQTQGLLWPRVAGKDDDGNLIPLTDALGTEIPALPPQLIAATSELAARATTGALVRDADRGGQVKRKKIGPIETEYMDGAPADKSFGVVAGILDPILNGSQPRARSATWYWL